MENINIYDRLEQLIMKRRRLKEFLKDMPSEGIDVSYTIRDEVLLPVVNKMVLNPIITAALRSKLDEELQIVEEQIKGYLRYDIE